MTAPGCGLAPAAARCRRRRAPSWAVAAMSAAWGGRRGRRGARVGEVTGRGYPPRSQPRGIAVRPWRLRHPADARGRVSGASARPQTSPNLEVACPPRAATPPTDDAARRRRSRPAQPKPASERSPSDVRLPHLPPLRPTSSICAAIVALTLSTAYIHSTLGGPLFTLNAIGYVVAAVAVGRPARHRRPIPLDRPGRADGLRGDRHRLPGPSWAHTSAPPISPRPSRSR